MIELDEAQQTIIFYYIIMSYEEKYKEILRTLEEVPQLLLPQLSEIVADHEEQQQFIIVDHNSDFSADFSCYAELESDSR